MKKLLITLLTLTLALLTFVSCNDGQSTTTTIKANGTLAQSRSLSARAASGAFASGDLKVNGQSIVNQLKPTTTSTSNNNVEFEATVEVPTPVIDLSVSPKAGYVFDEWELDKAALKKSNLSFAERKQLRAFLKQNEKAETITIDARFAQYIKATFDNGYYIDLNATENGDGSKESPFNSLDQIKADYHEDELTLKLAKNDNPEAATLNLADLQIKGLEEIKIIGGYGENWSYTVGDRTFIDSLVFDAANLELEIENIEVNNLTLPSSNGDDDELELSNIMVKESLIVNDNGVVGNLILADTAQFTGSNLTFVNCVVPYQEGNTYYHSIIVKGAESLDDKNLNNIILSGSENKLSGNNYILAENTEVNGFIVKVSDELKAELKQAKALDEDMFEYNEALEDLIEEDVFGMERDESKTATFGPVEL